MSLGFKRLNNCVCAFRPGAPASVVTDE